jgi:TonB family protein
VSFAVPNELPNRVFALGVALLICVGAAVNTPPAFGQQLDRRTKSKVVPNYPELAQRMKIAGVVRVQVTVSPSGSIKDTKIIGGHPLLATAALDAVKKWRFEAAAEESTGIVEFRFDPSQ